MKIESISIEGAHYPNEDRLRHWERSSETVFAVLADGMGGLSMGDVAAELIVKNISDYIIKNFDEHPIEQLLLGAMKAADDAVASKSAETHSRMGAAVALVLLDKGRLHYTWLGNVRVYLAGTSPLEMLTTDHVANVGYGNILLTRCIKGKGLRNDVPYQVREVTPGDVILLCTDGYYKQINMEETHSGSIPVIEDFEDDASIIRISV